MAATIHVHVGQCGNQLGERFWSLAAANTGGGISELEHQEQDSPARYEGAGSIRSSSIRSSSSSSSSPLFHAYDGKAAAVFIDSESKVVDRVRANPSLKRALRQDNFCTDSSGRANNWAMGFNASLRELERGEGLFHSAVEALRREMERVDFLQSVVLHHSLAGGTGSGLGSAMLQYLREVAPALNLTTVSVAPFASGDCATQWYNAAFTLHSLAADADAVILRDNDQLLRHHLQSAANVIGGSGSAARQRAVASKASMSALNDSFSQDLACLFFPTFHPPSSSPSSSLLPPAPQPWDARALVRACCPFTHAKLLDLRSSWSLLPQQTHQQQQGQRQGRPAASSSSSFRAAAAQGRRTGAALVGGDRAWLGIGQAVAASLPSHDDVEGQPVVTLGAQVTLRGVDPTALPPSPGQNPFLPLETVTPADPALASLLQEHLPRALRLAPWLPSCSGGGIAARYSSTTPAPAGASFLAPSPPHETCGLALCTNRSDGGAAVGRVLARATEMVEQRAYLHWYERHGVGVDDFAAAFDGLRRVREEYAELSSGLGMGIGGGGGAEEEGLQWRLHRRAALRGVRDYALN